MPGQWPERSAGSGGSSARGAGTALSFAIKLAFVAVAMNEGKTTVSSVLPFPTCSFHSIDFGSGVFLVLP